MNEAFVPRIRRALDQAANDIAPDIAARLHEAREQALARQRTAVGGLAVAGGPGFIADRLPALRILLAAAALLLGGAGAYQWNQFQKAVEQAEIDSALLADEIPFHAYTDQDFLKWLDKLATQETS